MVVANYQSWLKRVREPKNRGLVIGACGALIAIAAFCAGPESASGGGSASHNITVNVAPPATSDASDNSTIADWLNSQKLAPGQNPFVVHLDAFPVAGNGVAGDELGKSTGGPADQKKQRPQVLSELQRTAAGLRLQSVVMGMTPTAVINGVSAKEGDVVASFRIVRIESSGIVVEKDGAQFDIALDEANWRRVE
jgi:hypothetical protein